MESHFQITIYKKGSYVLHFQKLHFETEYTSFCFDVCDYELQTCVVFSISFKDMIIFVWHIIQFVICTTHYNTTIYGVLVHRMCGMYDRMLSMYSKYLCTFLDDM